ncbi:MAG: hypothetical protein ABSG78_13290 [Verrucomicrobiota bacterium]|jgi:hypothetical protein
MKPKNSKMKPVAVAGGGDNSAIPTPAHSGSDICDVNAAECVSLLEKPETFEEHIAIFERYGVLWWWRLKNDPRWTKSIVWEMVGRKENGDSLNSFEGALENRVRHVMWPFHVLFEYVYKRSAFLYEMKARINGKFEKFEFGKPWSRLTKEQWDTLAERWPMDKAGVRAYEIRRPLSTLPRPGKKPDPGWTDLHIWWNLHNPNAKLVQDFKARLDLERERLGQQLKVNQGTKYRNLSWRPIQLIDQRQFEKKVLTDGDRSQVSKAINKAKRVFNSTTN